MATRQIVLLNGTCLFLGKPTNNYATVFIASKGLYSTLIYYSFNLHSKWFFYCIQSNLKIQSSGARHVRSFDGQIN